MSHKTHLLCAFGVSDCLLSAPLHYVPRKLVGDDSGLRAQRWTAKRRRQKPKRHSAQAATPDPCSGGRCGCKSQAPGGPGRRAARAAGLPEPPEEAHRRERGSQGCGRGSRREKSDISLEMLSKPKTTEETRLWGQAPHGPRLCDLFLLKQTASPSSNLYGFQLKNSSKLNGTTTGLSVLCTEIKKLNSGELRVTHFFPHNE